ncbi:uncharacterized protein TEOVI_000430400 [Trypanosoma equiperdum]|uniref:Uncharacterized protein n=1 Tax=Trypanosoma equiperdum TaxID=5694 RepID=A0A1G4IJL0_TRYEQ|nr:hypothetical protein, conserved [Trypanosoma equiperdum]
MTEEKQQKPLYAQRLCGMVALTTLRAGDDLLAAAAKGKIREDVLNARATRLLGFMQPQSELSSTEEVLLRAFQQEFDISQPGVRHTLLCSFPPGDESGGFCHCARLYRPMFNYTKCETADYGYYLIDLSVVYKDPTTLLDELQKRWIALTKGLSSEEPELVLNIPEVILVVLHPSEAAPRTTLGSMLPSLVRLVSDHTGKEKEEENAGRWEVRMSGFPPRHKLNLPLRQLKQLCTVSIETRSENYTNGCNWIISSRRKSAIKSSSCNVHLVSSDFLKHSLFFMEWCVPEDFHLIPRWPALRGEGPTSDVLARLLLDVTKQEAGTTIPPEKVPQGRPRLNIDVTGKRFKELEGISRNIVPWVHVLCPQCVKGGDGTNSLSTTIHSHPDNSSEYSCGEVVRIPCALSSEAYNYYEHRVKTINGIKQDIDVRFVESVYTAVSTVPQQHLAVDSLLGQLEMTEEMFHNLSLLQGYGASVLPLSTGVAASTSVVAATCAVHAGKTATNRRVTWLLHKWEAQHRGLPERRKHTSAPPRSANESHIPEGIGSLLEVLREQFLTVTGSASPHRGPFFLSRDGEKMLETPFITGENVEEINERVVELADVAEVKCMFDVTTNSETDAEVNEENIMVSLPSGLLKDTLKSSIVSFAPCSPILGAVVNSNTGDGADSCVCEDDDLIVFEGASGCTCTPESLLELLGAVLNDYLKLFEGSERVGCESFCRRRMAQRESVATNGFWGAIMEELRHALVVVRDNGVNDFNGADGVAAHFLPKAAECTLQTLRKHLRDAACAEAPATEGRGKLWLKHIAFLLAHASFSNAAAGSAHVLNHRSKLNDFSSKVLDEERFRRFVRGLEGHLFFLDSALLAVDTAVLKRWKLADEELGRRHPN